MYSLKNIIFFLQNSIFIIPLNNIYIYLGGGAPLEPPIPNSKLWFEKCDSSEFQGGALPPFTGVGWPMPPCPPFQRVLSSQLKETFVFCESKKPGFLTLQYKTVKLCSFWFNLNSIKNIFELWTFLKMYRGVGGRSIVNQEKTTLPIQDILGVIFYIWGDSFQEGQIRLGKILNL